MTLAEVQAELVILRAANLRIVSGTQVEETQLPDGSRVRFSAAKITDLQSRIAYLETLEAQLLGNTTTLTGSRPILIRL